MRIPRQIPDRAHRHSRQREVDNELRQAFLPILRLARRAHQGDHVVAVLRVGGPYLAAVQTPAAFAARGPRANAGEVGAGIGLAHADAKEGFGATNFGQIELALRLRAELEDQGPALAVGDPVRGNRGAGGQQFFHQNEAREGIQVGTTVARRQGHADPTPCGQLLAKGGIEAHPGAGPDVGGHWLKAGLEKGLYLGAK